MTVQTCISASTLKLSSAEIEAEIQASLTGLTLVDWQVSKVQGALAYIICEVR